MLLLIIWLSHSQELSLHEDMMTTTRVFRRSPTKLHQMQAFFFLIYQMLPVYLAAATDINDCSNIQANGKKFNLSSLFTPSSFKNITVLTIDREGISTDQYNMLFSICSPLTNIGVSDKEYGNECTKGTHRACRVIINKKDGEVNRITSLKAYSDANSYAKIDDSQHDNLVIELRNTNTSNTLRITGKCSTEGKEEEPVSVSFTAASTSSRGTGGKLEVYWAHKLFCGISTNDDGNSQSGKSFLGFIGWFIQWTLTFLAIYFAIGIAYNFYVTRGKNEYDKLFTMIPFRIPNTPPNILA